MAGSGIRNGEPQGFPFCLLPWLAKACAGVLESAVLKRRTAMKRLFAAIALVAWSFVGFAQSRTTWDGLVTDMHCGTNCQRTSDMKPDKACVRLCVRRGSKYGL